MSRKRKRGNRVKRDKERGRNSEKWGEALGENEAGLIKLNQDRTGERVKDDMISLFFLYFPRLLNSPSSVPPIPHGLICLCLQTQVSLLEMQFTSTPEVQCVD